MEKYRRIDGNLFRGQMFYDYQISKNKEIEAYINQLPQSKVLETEESELVEDVYNAVIKECPRVDFDNISMEPREVLAEIHDGYYSTFRTAEVKCKVIRLFFPVEGETSLLTVRPSTILTAGWNNLVLSGHDVYVDMLFRNEDEANIQREIQCQISDFKRMMEFLEEDIKAYNSLAQREIPAIIQRRKEKLIAANSLYANLGIPIRSKHNTSNTYSVSSVIKKEDVSTQVIASSKVRELEPMMAEKVYCDILSSMNEIGKNLEKYPETYKGRDEETIRALFLTQLNSSFQAFSGTGESFNNHGKTDIMVRRNNEVLFVAECKIWKGAVALDNAITQLLSYLTWRESKTSLLLFVKKQQLTKVIESVKAAVPNHSNYVTTNDAESDTWLNYTFHMDGDERKIVRLAIQIFDFKED